MKTVLRDQTFLFAWGVVFLASLGAQGQETLREIDKPGKFNKYLTPGMVDRWTFSGNKDDMVFATVTTKDFDATVQLVREIDAREQVLLEVDDDGSNSSLAYRLPADGDYKILVRGFAAKGGGNYSLDMKQFAAKPIKIGQQVAGGFDEGNEAYFYFRSDGSEFITVDLEGFAIAGWALFDTKGQRLQPWYQLFELKEPGEYVIQVRGKRSNKFDLTVHPAQRSLWETGDQTSSEIAKRTAHVVDIDAKPDQFRVIEIESDGSFVSQITSSPLKKKKRKRIGERTRQPLLYLPIGSKGAFTRYAVVWGLEDRFQLRLYSERGAKYRASYSDPSKEVPVGTAFEDKIPIGGAKFYKLQVESGQILKLDASSQQFDTNISLYDSEGNLVARNDDAFRTTNSSLQYTTYRSQQLLAVVASIGNGGGGTFQVTTSASRPPRFAFGEKIKIDGPQRWVVDAKKGQLMIFHLDGISRSPALRLLNSNGVAIASAENQSDYPHASLAYRPETDERLTLVTGGKRSQNCFLRGLKIE